MTPISLEEAQSRHPDLVEQVVRELAQSRPDLDPDRISWYAVSCGSSPEDLMDEGAIADHLLTGYVPCQVGLGGSFDGDFRCACDTELVEPGTL